MKYHCVGLRGDPEVDLPRKKKVRTVPRGNSTDCVEFNFDASLAHFL